MIKYNNSTIYDWNFGDGNIIKVYRNNAVVFYKVSGESPTPPTPTGQTPCFAVVDDISQYQDRTYDDAYDKASSKWYMKNNLNQYEQYGVFETGNSLSDFTYYDGKLVATGTTEYQYSGSSWVEVGTYEDSSTTLEINENTTGDYQGTVLPTTFKIPYADVESMGSVSFRISDTNGGSLNINLDIDGDYYEYFYDDGDEFEEGTVTNDGEYLYLSLPTTTQIEIDSIDYYDSETIHIIYGSKTVSVEYEEKERPMFAETYADVTEMQSSQCPFVGKYGVVSNDAYQFNANNVWVVDNSIKLKAIYNGNSANVIDCGSSTELTENETKPSYLTAANMTSAVIGDCVTSIGTDTFNACTSLSSVTIGSGVTSIGSYAFQGCTSLSSVTIPNSVTSIGNTVFYYCTSLSSVIIPNSVISIGNTVFYNCSSLSSITIPNSVTSIGNNAFGYCSGLTEVTIPNSVTSIGNTAFNACTSLSSVTIGSGVTSIGNMAFRNCTSLSSITLEATTPPTLGSDVFTNTSSSLVIYVPSGSVDAYKAAPNWSTYASRIQAKPNS